MRIFINIQYSERYFVTRRPKIMVFHCFKVWKKKYLQRKFLQNAGTVKIISTRCDALLVYYALDPNDAIQFNFISRFKTLKKYWLKRKFWKAFIGILWYERAMQIKRHYFNILRYHYRTAEKPTSDLQNLPQFNATLTKYKTLKERFMNEYNKNKIRDPTKEFYLKFTVEYIIKQLYNEEFRFQYDFDDKFVLTQMFFLMIEDRAQDIGTELRSSTSQLYTDDAESKEEAERKETVARMKQKISDARVILSMFVCIIDDIIVTQTTNNKYYRDKMME
jgi:hypothetical protein